MVCFEAIVEKMKPKSNSKSKPRKGKSLPKARRPRKIRWFRLCRKQGAIKLNAQVVVSALAVTAFLAFSLYCTAQIVHEIIIVRGTQNRDVCGGPPVIDGANPPSASVNVTNPKGPLVVKGPDDANNGVLNALPVIYPPGFQSALPVPTSDSTAKSAPASDQKPGIGASHRESMERFAPLIFCSLLLFVTIAFLSRQRHLPRYKQLILRVLLAVLAGAAAECFTGEIGVTLEWVRATGSLGVFVWVFQTCKN